MKNRKRSAVDIALIRLNHLPFVVTNNRKMAVWSDLKEIMLWCPSPQCCVVLDALKLILGYPAYERAMHPCSQLEQLMFLKHFMFVTHGTLLVDIDSLRDGARLALLYNMVKEKHTKPNNQTVFNCTKMLKTFTEKYANTSFKIPLSSASGKMLLPAVRRISKSAARGEIHIPNNDQDSGRGHSRSHDFSRRLDNDGDDGILEPNRPEPFAQTKLGGSTSRTLLPLALLCKLYPGCEGFLEEVVRLYILGQCGEEYLQSVCQCTTEEGIQLTRFLASQNGYDTFWLCLTTCSLMMSWSEFWLGYDRMWGGRLEVMSGDVCVVTLNCQTTDVGQNDKAITNKQKNAAPRKQTVPTQPSPSLSTINDITENVQSQNLSGPLAILSEESLEDTAYCKCDQNCQAHIKTVVDEIESTVESSNLDSELVTTKSDEGNEDNEKQRELEKKVIKCSGKKSKKKSSGTEKIKTLSRGRNKEIDVPKADDKTVSELNSCEKTKPHKARRKNKKPKAVDRDATEQDTGSRGIKSRLRSRNPARKITKEKSVISKRDANNSAITNAIASSLQRSGSSDSNKSGSKSDEMTEYFHPVAEQVAEVNKPSSRCSQCIPLKTELPISEVSPYDLASMKYSQMAGIHVSVTPKKAQGIHRENVPFFEKPNIAKKKVENLQSIRNRRESLKISSAEIQDELPVSFKYTSNAPAVKLSSSPTAEQACSVTRKRGKWYNKFGADPKKIQKSKTIPHKLIKSTEDTARRNRTEALIHRPRTDPFSVVLEGKPYQQTTTIYSYELGQSSADKQRDSFGSPAVESCTHSFSTNKTGPLHEKIVNNLQKQAFSSFRSVSGNQDEKGNLAAEGKAMKQYDKLKDLNSSEFLEQRVKKWKNEVEQSLNIAGRLSKSADLVKRRNMGTYRPRSCGCRPNSTPLDGRVQSFKTSLCSLFSRDCASPNMFDKQVCCQASANETIERQDSENFANEYSNKYSSPSPLTADNDKIVHAGTGNGQFKLDYQYEVQNYGSSSSLTPDIYDEFARKKNPKSMRPDIVKIKPKPVTIPSPFTLSQPVVRKQPQPSLQVSKKANFHTVGYMSSAEQSQQQREDSSSTFNEDIKQMYHYSQTKLTNCPSQQKGLTSNNPHTFCQGNDILTTDPSENKHLHSDKELLVPKNCHPAGEKHVEKFLPHTFVSSTSVNSVGNQQTALYVNHDPAKVETFPFLSQTYRFDNSTHVGCLQGHEKTDNYKDKQEAENTLCGMMYDSADGKNSNISALNKLSNFRHFEITPGKLESLDYISSIQALLPNTNVISALPEKDCTHLESTNCTRKCLSEVTTTTTKNGKYALLGSSHQTGLNCQRSKSELKYEENKLLDPRPREHTLSKVNTQLYYKVPGEDIVHPVSENVIIPKYAQFFVQATATENDVCVKEKKIILDKDNILEKDTIVVTTNGKEAVGSEPRKETDTSEYRGNKPAKSNSSEEERLSSTTFDKIIKASEDFIDKSRLIKHVISKTKQAIENTKAEEDVASPGNQIKVSDIKTNIGEQIEEREGDEYQKVIIPSSGQVTEKQSTSRKKSFKDIIEEKREEKRKLQLHLSRKKYWNSAHAKKDGNTGNLSIDNRSNKQKNEGQLDKSRVKAAPKQNNDCFNHETNIDKQNRKGKCERQINSKFVIASPRRPKTCIGFGKGRTAMNVSNAGIKMKKDPPALSARSHTDFAMNKKFDKVGPFDRSKYQQHTKPATIFARAKNSKSQPPKEADDCTSKILTALRRLSIEKSPKITEQKASLKQEMRQNKLSACVSKQTKLVKVSHTDKEKDKKSNNTVLMKDSNDLHEVHNDENIQEEVKHIGMEENTEVSKISVVIGMRKVCNDEVPES
ncbi:uncharacterized protein LOC123540702 isoform X2 [Mercenaria mercenaria]|nr:uncharacterized protein LOC123540702 isoform X2 [Mercenaria mercenaria]